MEPEQPTDNPLDGFNVQPTHPQPQGAQQPAIDPNEVKLSKAQQKKLRNKEKWEQARRLKKIRKKQLKKEKADTEKKELPNQLIPKQFVPQRRRKEDYIEKLQKGLRVVIDLQFFSDMTDKEKNSLFKQLTHCHSTNRRMEKACHLTITSTEGQAHQTLTTKYNAQNWGIFLQPKHFLQCYPLQSLVYLTGDAEEELDQLQLDKVYIIGGLVDHNRLKKITYNYAVEHKIRMARFPLGKYVDLKSNCHLAVNHVYEILLKVYNQKSWEEAIKESIPNRKLNQPTGKQQVW